MRRIVCFGKSNTGEIARSRLKLLLVSDQAQVNAGLIDLIREDMVGVLSRYAEVDSSHMELKLLRTGSRESEGQMPVLSASFPIRRITTKRK